MEETIKHSNDAWFYKAWETRDMPTLGMKDKLQEEKNTIEEAIRNEKIEKERKEKEDKEKREKENVKRSAEEPKNETVRQRRSREKTRDRETDRMQEIDNFEIDQENLKYVKNLVQSSSEMNTMSYRTTLESNTIREETQMLKNKMSELLNRYKINEEYDQELNGITRKFEEIRDKYREITRKYETIQEEVTANRNKMEDFIESWRILRRENQRRLDELYDQLNELKRTSESVRLFFWEMGEASRELKTMSTWTIYWMQSRYNWPKLREREYIATETERYFENGSRAASEASSELKKSLDLVEAMMDMTNKN